MAVQFKSGSLPVYPITPAQFSVLGRVQQLASDVSIAPRMVAALAVIGLAWQAAQLTRMWIFPEHVVSHDAHGAVDTNASPPGDDVVDASTIANAHLFGSSQIGDATVDPNGLPATRLNLVLAGTMALADAAAGFAIVGENAANAKFYRAGSLLVDGARLCAVYADRVVIDRNGVLETLLLPRVAGGSQLDRSIAASLAAPDDDALNGVLRVQPVVSNDDIRGYRVYPGRDAQQFARLGLQPGDMITMINDTALDQPDIGNALLKKMTASGASRITVIRGDRSVELTSVSLH